MTTRRRNNSGISLVSRLNYRRRDIFTTLQWILFIIVWSRALTLLPFAISILPGRCLFWLLQSDVCVYLPNRCDNLVSKALLCIATAWPQALSQSEYSIWLQCRSRIKKGAGPCFSCNSALSHISINAYWTSLLSGSSIAAFWLKSLRLPGRGFRKLILTALSIDRISPIRYGRGYLRVLLSS